MLKIIITVSLLLIFNPNLLPQWSTDPNNNLIIGYGLNPELCSDSTGGCYITYEVGYPSKLYLHRIDKYGYQPWGDKRIIAGELDEQRNAKIIEDGEGGVIVSYGDRIMNNSYRLRLQKVDSIGNFLWGPTGVKVSITDTRQSVQRLVKDGKGGCVIVWIDTLAEYRINRIDKYGQRVWGDSGIVLGINGYYDKPIIAKTTTNYYVVSAERDTYKYLNANGQIFYTGSVTWLSNFISDQDGGIIVANRGGQWPADWQIQAQRKDSLGNSIWPEPNVIVAESCYVNTYNLMNNNNGLYFFSWSGMKNGIDQIAQFQALRNNGSKLFTQGSISISDNKPLSAIGIIPSEESKTIFLWNDDPNLADSTLAQLYDTLGNEIWNENGIVIAHPAFSYIGYTVDQNGGFIIGGTINDFTIVAQQVSKYGNLGEIITSVPQESREIFPTEITLYQNYPNPFNPTTTMKYDLPDNSDVSLIIYDILGRKVKELVNTKQPAGKYEVQFDASNLPSGVYIYQLVAENPSTSSGQGYISSRKMILLK